MISEVIKVNSLKFGLTLEVNFEDDPLLPFRD